MYHFFRQTPLVRPAIFFMTGIVFHQSGSMLIWWLTPALLLLHLYLTRQETSLYKVSLFIPSLFLLSGYAHSFFCQASVRPGAKPLEKFSHSLLQAEEFPEEKGNFYRVKAKCLEVKDSQGIYPAAEEPVLVFIEKDSNSAQLVPGSIFLAAAKWNKDFHPGNPAAFDYKQFLQRKNIRYQAFVRAGHWKPSGNTSRFSLLHLTRRWQRSMTRQLDITIGDSIVSGISKAILLGDTHDLDSEVKNSFSLTGTMHVLAVSGMHVVVLFIILNSLFSPIRNSLLRSVLLLMILWFYAMLTGLSASVLRSVVMFSFVIVGKELNRQTSVYNSLALSALVLAVADPAMIFQVGFQLSFLAVLGIVFFHPYLLALFPTDIKWKKYLLDLVGLSLAAQLSTSPLSIYYFHQFPNYFLLSNFFIVPLSTPILVLSLCVLVFSPVPYLSELLSWCLRMITRLTLYINDIAANLPYANSTGIPFNGWQCLLLYTFIIALSAWLILKKRSHLTVAAVCLAGLIAIPIYLYYQNSKKAQLVIYQVKGKSCLEIQYGNTLFFSGDVPDPSEKNYALSPYLMDRGFWGDTPWAGNKSLWQLFPFGRAGEFFGTKILILDDTCGLHRIREPVITDLLIISKNLRLKTGKLAESFRFRKLVLDSSNDSRTRKFWAKEAVKGNFDFYDIMEEGALIWNFYGKDR